VETFNRIVMFVKEKLSHFGTETHENSASQVGTETHENCASQYDHETQLQNTSYSIVETQQNNALKLLKTKSYTDDETQRDNALKLLKTKRYAEFVRKYVLSHFDIETHENRASQCVIETHEKCASQKEYETKNSLAFFQELNEIQNLIWFHNRLYETEKELYKKLNNWSKDHPLRRKYLNRVKGIGGVLASGIIAWLTEPILKAVHVSQIWSYCGLTPESLRKRNERLKYNPKLKVFCWKIGQSFIRFKCFGRRLYDNFKEQVKQKHPDWSKLHVHNYARRKVVKLFIASVWEVWRKMNNLQVTKPYAIEFLGHKDVVTPEMWMEKNED